MGFGQLQTPPLVVGPIIPATMPLLPGTAAAIIPAAIPTPTTAASTSEATLTSGQRTMLWIAAGIFVAGGIYWMVTEPKQHMVSNRRRARRNPYRTDFDRLKDCQLEVQALRREVSR